MDGLGLTVIHLWTFVEFSFKTFGVKIHTKLKK